MTEVVPLNYNATFKRVFSEPAVFKQFVDDLLGLALEIDVVHSDYQYKETVGYVHVKYDLLAEDSEKRTIVEVQHVKHDDFFDRFLYYHLIGLLEETRDSQGYRFGKAVYTIVVLTNLPANKQVPFSHGIQDLSFLTEFGKFYSPYPHRLIVLVPDNVNEQTPIGIKQWLELIKDSFDRKVDETLYPSTLFKHMIGQIRRSMVSSAEWAYIKDQESQIMTAATERQRAFTEGQSSGKQAEKRATARKMLVKGWEIAEIVEMTGLSEAEIVTL